MVDDETLAAAGALIWTARPRLRHRLPGRRVRPRRRLARRRPAPAAPRQRSPSPRVERIAVVSGSCSPVTADADRRAPRPPASRSSTSTRTPPTGPPPPTAALAALAARPLAARRHRARRQPTPAWPTRAALGAGLGRLLDRLVREAGLTRAVIAGGDTSSHAARALGLVALTAEAPVAHGAALLRGHRADGSTLEIALKGGQMGPPDFFVRIRDGQATEGGAAAA